MDIIDILIAKALTPQGQIETYATMAQTAVSQATQAVTNAETAVSTANSANTAANNALNQLNTIKANITQAANDEIDKLAFDLIQANTNQLVRNSIQVTYPSGEEETLASITKYYKTTGLNEDGTMTQKAITQALQNAGGSGGSTNLGSENANHMVIVGDDGNIVASSSVTESDIITALLKSNSYTAVEAVGLQVDYKEYVTTRIQEAADYNAGADFNQYSMYGGRMRCVVNNQGRILAFYGDNGYSDTPGNGNQVMVYQPKFYYSRIPISLEDAVLGKVIREQAIMISDKAQTGFTLHPLFINEDGEQLDYVLLPAYEGSIESTTGNSYTDEAINNFTSQKLASVANAKPITGLNNPLNVVNAQLIANNRGEGWHITNLQFESAMQMLEVVEFGTFNVQSVLEEGIGQIQSSVTLNNSAITGSTASLGNTTGAASETTFTINGDEITYNTPGKRAISYRGVENPWGDTWRFIGGINIYGNGSSQGGSVYICNNFNYDVTNNTNYDSVGFYLPNTNGWISGFGYGTSKFDWTFIPVECASSANNTLPIGDSLWITQNLNSSHTMACGGSWAYNQLNGPFYYACDRMPNEQTSRHNARLMYIPHKSDTYYDANITLWENKYGG